MGADEGDFAESEDNFNFDGKDLMNKNKDFTRSADEVWAGVNQCYCPFEISIKTQFELIYHPPPPFSEDKALLNSRHPKTSLNAEHNSPNQMHTEEPLPRAVLHDLTLFYCIKIKFAMLSHVIIQSCLSRSTNIVWLLSIREIVFYCCILLLLWYILSYMTYSIQMIF